jgi:hypothetical protein
MIYERIGGSASISLLDKRIKKRVISEKDDGVAISI